MLEAVDGPGIETWRLTDLENKSRKVFFCRVGWFLPPTRASIVSHHQRWKLRSDFFEKEAEKSKVSDFIFPENLLLDFQRWSSAWTNALLVEGEPTQQQNSRDVAPSHQLARFNTYLGNHSSGAVQMHA